MKLIINKPGEAQRDIEGDEARWVLRSVLQSIGQNVLIPEMPYTGRIRVRAIHRLREGKSVWTHPGRHGEVTARSTVICIPLKIVGVILADGTIQDLTEEGSSANMGAAGMAPDEADHKPETDGHTASPRRLGD